MFVFKEGNINIQDFDLLNRNMHTVSQVVVVVVNIIQLTQSKNRKWSWLLLILCGHRAIGSYLSLPQQNYTLLSKNSVSLFNFTLYIVHSGLNTHPVILS